MNKCTFINENGEFKVDNPHKISYTYFPLTNLKGMMSSITPILNGDIKIDNNHFALLPVSQEDLHNSKASRNFWIDIENYGLWSATGNCAKQIVEDEDKVTLEGGFLYHKITRINEKAGVTANVLSFVPVENDFVELTKVTIKNTSNKKVKFTPTIAIPLYSRSADNLRDHRHVTALLNRATILENGIMNKPSLSFDERGHTKNNVSYGVFGFDESNNYPCKFFPVLEEFIGEGGSLDWPKTLTNKIENDYEPGDKINGYEVMGAMQFNPVEIEPNEENSYVFIIGIDENGGNFEEIIKKYSSIDAFDRYLEESKSYWKNELDTLCFGLGDSNYNNWLKWVTLQPILRRIYGCSFLPHHDYGRGGRGWRDLWQDCLALILMNPEDVRYLLYNNYGGVRVDGSNATIIGSKPGEFLADRNNIPRVWMDHGVWPFVTTKLYIDRSGDIDFLFENQTYFKDSHVSYSREIDNKYNDKYGNKQLNNKNETHKGSILEHILIQNLTPFFNVGDNNNLRLEGADWNDGLDMASNNGESVAFTAFYGKNLLDIAEMLQSIREKRNLDTIELFEEMKILFDTIDNPVNYHNVSEKKELLNTYFNSCKHNISGNKVCLNIEDIIDDLRKKGNYIIENIRENDWLSLNDDLGWFNGYYDNDGNPLESADCENIKMTLTGQVFTIMSGVAKDEQIEKIVKATDKYLRDDTVGGYRLNNDFKELKLNMGRLFGFAYGHKENGAVFSHMAMMYSNALYKRGYAKEGYEVLNSLYTHCKDFNKSKIYPGIPEYIDAKGRGMYHYLTGSASWMILNMIDEVFGVKGHLGDLVLEPKLLKVQFDVNNEASVKTLFADEMWDIVYINNGNKEYGEYKIINIKCDNEEIAIINNEKNVVIPKETLSKLSNNKLVVTLG